MESERERERVELHASNFNSRAKRIAATEHARSLAACEDGQFSSGIGSHKAGGCASSIGGRECASVCASDSPRKRRDEISDRAGIIHGKKRVRQEWATP